MIADAVTERARELAPWHFDFDLGNGHRTSEFNDPHHPNPDKRGSISVLDPYHLGRGFLREYYPNGLAGKEVLDVGCNSGGYCFVAAELGAKRVVGFDVRQHWIEQAKFIHSTCYPRLTNLHFKVGDAHSLMPEIGKVDLVIFKGVFYHLPDPIHVLLELCNAARETVFFNTASDEAIPEHCLSVKIESKTRLMSGVHGLSWWPGGPAAIQPILEYAGFRHFKADVKHDVAPGQGRFTLVGRR